MERSPVESGICSDETLNPKLARINPKVIREENLFCARIKVKMEMIKKNTSLMLNILSTSDKSRNPEFVRYF